MPSRFGFLRGSYLRKPSTAAALSIAVALCGCDSRAGSGDPVQELRSTLPQNPCDILDKSEIAASAGTALRNGVENVKTGTPPPLPVVGMRFCLFQSSAPGGPVVQVGLVSNFASEAFEKLKTDPSLQPLLPVEGLGQEALSKELGPIGWVTVLAGDKVLGIHVSFVKTSSVEVAHELALKALPKL